MAENKQYITNAQENGSDALSVFLFLPVLQEKREAAETAALCKDQISSKVPDRPRSYRAAP